MSGCEDCNTEGWLVFDQYREQLRRDDPSVTPSVHEVYDKSNWLAVGCKKHVAEFHTYQHGGVIRGLSIVPPVVPTITTSGNWTYSARTVDDQRDPGDEASDA